VRRYQLINRQPASGAPHLPAGAGDTPAMRQRSRSGQQQLLVFSHIIPISAKIALFFFRPWRDPRPPAPMRTAIPACRQRGIRTTITLNFLARKLPAQASPHLFNF
jgi:hypothetical protein